MTVYGLPRSQPTTLPQLIARYRRALKTDPADDAARYFLANCLYGIGQEEEAQREWAKVAAASIEWSRLVAETQEAVSQMPEQEN